MGMLKAECRKVVNAGCDLQEAAGHDPLQVAEVLKMTVAARKGLERALSLAADLD